MTWKHFALIAALVFLATNRTAFVCAADEAATGTYLQEPPAEPPAKVARRQKVQDKYPDGELRFERSVAQLSDDSVVSDGPYVEFYPNGQKFCEGSYEMGVMVGEWNYWHDNGQADRSLTYKAGKPDGKVEIRRADGTLASLENYQNGVRSGEWISYFEDGTTPKIKAVMDQGQVNGERLTYHPNGQVRQKANLANGVFEGEMTEYDETGKMIARANFKAGELQGKVERFE